MGPQIRIGVDASFHSSKLVFSGPTTGSGGPPAFWKKECFIRLLTSFICGGFQFCGRTQSYCYVYASKRVQDPAPRQNYPLTVVPPWSPHPLPSLISNFLNLPFGIQERSRRLTEAYFKQEMGDRSSHCGGAKTNLTKNHEVVGSIPSFAQWVKDLALP